MNDSAELSDPPYETDRNSNNQIRGLNQQRTNNTTNQRSEQKITSSNAGEQFQIYSQSKGQTGESIVNVQVQNNGLSISKPWQQMQQHKVISQNNQNQPNREQNPQVINHWEFKTQKNNEMSNQQKLLQKSGNLMAPRREETKQTAFIFPQNNARSQNQTYLVKNLHSNQRYQGSQNQNGHNVDHSQEEEVKESFRHKFTNQKVISQEPPSNNQDQDAPPDSFQASLLQPLNNISQNYMINEESQGKAECSFCKQLYDFSYLDLHEQTCVTQQSLKRIAEICESDTLDARKFQPSQNHRYEDYERSNLISNQYEHLPILVQRSQQIQSSVPEVRQQSNQYNTASRQPFSNSTRPRMQQLEQQEDKHEMNEVQNQEQNHSTARQFKYLDRYLKSDDDIDEVEEEKINLVDNSIISFNNQNLINALQFDNSDKEDFDDDEEDERQYMANLINRNNHSKFKNELKIKMENEQRNRAITMSQSQQNSQGEESKDSTKLMSLIKSLSNNLQPSTLPQINLNSSDENSPNNDRISDNYNYFNQEIQLQSNQRYRNNMIRTQNNDESNEIQGGLSELAQKVSVNLASENNDDSDKEEDLIHTNFRYRIPDLDAQSDEENIHNNQVEESINNDYLTRHRLQRDIDLLRASRSTSRSIDGDTEDEERKVNLGQISHNDSFGFQSHQIRVDELDDQMMNASRGLRSFDRRLFRFPHEDEYERRIMPSNRRPQLELIMNYHHRSDNDDEDEDFHSAVDDEDDEHQLEDYEALLNLDENVVHAVPKQVIGDLPKAKFTEGNRANFSEENKSCTICMCQYELEEEYLILPCLHRFHLQCITEWFQRRNTCPNCKDRVTDHFGGDPSRQQHDEHNLFFDEEDDDNNQSYQLIQGQRINRLFPRGFGRASSQYNNNNMLSYDLPDININMFGRGQSRMIESIIRSNQGRVQMSIQNSNNYNQAPIVGARSQNQNEQMQNRIRQQFGSNNISNLNNRSSIDDEEYDSSHSQ